MTNNAMQRLSLSISGALGTIVLDFSQVSHIITIMSGLAVTIYSSLQIYDWFKNRANKHKAKKHSHPAHLPHQ